MVRPYFNKSQKIDKKISQIIMVNHAGELGAKRIYQGQLDFIRNKDDFIIIKHMLEQELKHLEFFEQQIKEGKSKPTILIGIWNKLGYAIGAISSLLGTKSAMLLTESIEKIIVKHYEQQLEFLKNNHLDKKLINKIKIFKNEEESHINVALENDSDKFILYNSLSFLIKKLCKFSILLSKTM